MRKALFAVAAVVALLMAARAFFRSPVPDIDPRTAARLSTSADRWCEQSPDWAVPPEEWPAEIRHLSPLAVRVTPDGVYVELGSRFAQSWGVFVLRTGSTFRPAGGTDPSYRPLGGRVYWYEVKG